MTLAQIMRAIGAGLSAASLPVAPVQPILAGALNLLGTLADVAADGIDQGVTDAELIATLKRAKRINTAAADAALDMEVDAKPSRV